MGVMKKTILTVAGTLLAGWIALNGWYYLQVLRWVDQIRINDALKQAAQAQKAPPPAPTVP